jgi:hypothetical protein
MICRKIPGLSNALKSGSSSMVRSKVDIIELVGKCAEISGEEVRIPHDSCEKMTS